MCVCIQGSMLAIFNTSLNTDNVKYNSSLYYNY